MRDYARTVGLPEPEPDRWPATTREAIDELVQAHELLCGERVEPRDVVRARVKVLQAIAVLRAVEGER